MSKTEKVWASNTPAFTNYEKPKALVEMSENAWLFQFKIASGGEPVLICDEEEFAGCGANFE